MLTGREEVEEVVEEEEVLSSVLLGQEETPSVHTLLPSPVSQQLPLTA